MPHIIIEHSNNIEPEVNVQKIVEDAHEALASQGIDKGRIKTRAVAVNNFSVGDKGKEGAFVHITLLLLEGRDIPTKQQYGQAIHKAVQVQVADKIAGCAITLEVRDMVTEAYIL